MQSTDQYIAGDVRQSTSFFFNMVLDIPVSNDCCLDTFQTSEGDTMTETVKKLLDLFSDTMKSGKSAYVHHLYEKGN